MNPGSDDTEVWVSDGLPEAALARLHVTSASVQRFPLVGGVTVWDEPPDHPVMAAVASPNRLGVLEPLAAMPWWETLWWWADPLSPDPPGYGPDRRVERVVAPVDLPAQRTLDEAGARALRAAEYLTRRLRHLRGVRIPQVAHGRRFPLMLPVDPVRLMAGGAEEFRIPRPVDGWPGLVICEAGWWQSTDRLDGLIGLVRQAVEGDQPSPLRPAERVWSSPAP